MPNPALVATVNAGGKIYSAWESIEISRRYDDVISHMHLRVAEASSSGKTPSSWANVQLMPGVSAQGYLAGQLAISGQVCVRNPAYDAENHAVQIVVASNTFKLACSTVSGTPGQYISCTWLQIAVPVAGAVGVNVRLLSGTDKVFPRVSETIGEPRFQFIERLSRMRNLYLCDDQNGNLVATQGTGGIVATLIEGRNIKKANIAFRNDEYGNPATVIGANIGGSSTGIWGGPARDPTATVAAPNMPTSTPQTVAAEEPGDQIDMQMRAARQAAWNLAQYIEGSITVFGWQLDDASLWLNHCGDLVTINSPMILAQPLVLAIKGVTSRQDNQNGTETELVLCDPGALGALNKGQSVGTVAAPGATLNEGAGLAPAPTDAFGQ